MSGSAAKKIRKQVEERVSLEAAELGDLAKASPEAVPALFTQSCLQANELGDGNMFACIHQGRFVFDATAGEWLIWRGHFWERDVKGEVLAAVEQVVARYLEEAKGMGRQLAVTKDEAQAELLKAQMKRIGRRIDRLRTVKGRRACLEFATTLAEGALVITGEQLDANPWLLAFSNGVVDFRVGQLRDGRPNEYITKASPFPFPVDCSDYLATGNNSPCPTLEAFVLEIVGDDQEKAAYLRRALGYAITGLTREQVFLIFAGGGRNGKGVLMEILQKVLGPLAGPIPAEMLLDQGRSRSSAGPSPDIMSLRGLRIAFASETDQGRRFAASRVKWLSGGDTLTGRNPHDRAQVTFPPSHLLILATNFKPQANADDHAFWARMHLVNFPLSFVERPSAPNERKIDKTLEEKLMSEASGILAWLVRGCLEWQAEGLNPPAVILKATAEYRRREDDLAGFLEEKCEIREGAEVTAKAIYSAFKEWFIANIADKAPSQKRFGEMLGRRFEKDSNGPGKTIRYLGLELRDSF